MVNKKPSKTRARAVAIAAPAPAMRPTERLKAIAESMLSQLELAMKRQDSASITQLIGTPKNLVPALNTTAKLLTLMNLEEESEAIEKMDEELKLSEGDLSLLTGYINRNKLIDEHMEKLKALGESYAKEAVRKGDDFAPKLDELDEIVSFSLKRLAFLRYGERVVSQATAERWEKWLEITQDFRRV